MRTTKTYLLFSLLAALAAVASLPLFAAGEPSPSERLTLSLDEAVATGLQRNRKLEIARLERDMASEKVREAWSGVLPQLASEFEYTRHVKPAVIYFPDFSDTTGAGSGNLTALEISADNAMTASLSLRQKLFDYRAIAGIRASSIVGKMSDEAYREVEADVIADIQIAYYNVLIADEQVAILRQSVSRWEKALEDSRALFSQGVAADIDTLRAFLSVENIRPDLIQARSRSAVARTEFKNVVGIDPSQPVAFSDSLVYRAGRSPAGLDSAYSEAIVSRPEVRRLELQVEVGDENVSAARAEGYPAVTAVGRLQAQTQFDDGVAVGDTDWPVTSSVGVQVSLPLFTGFGTSSRIEQAKIGRMQTIRQLEDLKAAIRAEVQTKLYRLEESRTRIEVQQKTVETAERSYEITRLRFREGIGSQLELTDAELQLNKAKTNYLQAIYDYLVSRIEYDKALGRTSAPDGETPGAGDA